MKNNRSNPIAAALNTLYFAGSLYLNEFSKSLDQSEAAFEEFLGAPSFEAATAIFTGMVSSKFFADYQEAARNRYPSPKELDLNHHLLDTGVGALRAILLREKTGLPIYKARSDRRLISYGVGQLRERWIGFVENSNDPQWTKFGGDGVTELVTEHLNDAKGYQPIRIELWRDFVDYLYQKSPRKPNPNLKERLASAFHTRFVRDFFESMKINAEKSPAKFAALQLRYFVKFDNSFTALSQSVTGVTNELKSLREQLEAITRNRVNNIVEPTWFAHAGHTFRTLFIPASYAENRNGEIHELRAAIAGLGGFEQRVADHLENVLKFELQNQARRFGSIDTTTKDTHQLLKRALVIGTPAAVLGLGLLAFIAHVLIEGSRTGKPGPKPIAKEGVQHDPANPPAWFANAQAITNQFQTTGGTDVKELQRQLAVHADEGHEAAMELARKNEERVNRLQEKSLSMDSTSFAFARVEEYAMKLLRESYHWLNESSTVSEAAGRSDYAVLAIDRAIEIGSLIDPSYKLYGLTRKSELLAMSGHDLKIVSLLEDLGHFSMDVPFGELVFQAEDLLISVLSRLGRLGEAETRAKKLVENVKAFPEWGPKSRRYSDALRIDGRVRNLRNDHVGAIELLTQAIEVHEGVHEGGENCAELITPLRIRAAAYAGESKFDEAGSDLDRCLRILEGAKVKDYLAASAVYMDKASMLRAKADSLVADEGAAKKRSLFLNDALKTIMLADETYQLAGEKNVSLEIAILGLTGTVYSQMDEREQARGFFEKAKEAARGHYGNGHPTTIAEQFSYAQFVRRTDGFGKAEADFAEAIGAAKTFLDKSDPALVVYLFEYSGVLSAEGRLKEGYDLSQEALKVAVSQPYSDSGCLLVLHAMKPFLEAILHGRLEGAEATLKELEREASGKDRDEDEVRTLIPFFRAILLCEQGDFSQGLPLFDLVLTEFDHPELETIVSMVYARMLLRSGNNCESENVALSVLARSESGIEMKIQNRVGLLTSLAAIYTLRGEFSRRDEICKVILALVESGEIAIDATTSGAAEQVAWFLHDRGETFRAAEVFETAIREVEKQMGDSPSILGSLLLSYAAMVLQSDPGAAETSSGKAMDLFLNLKGAGSRDAVSSAVLLLSCLEKSGRIVEWKSSIGKLAGLLMADADLSYECSFEIWQLARGLINVKELQLAESLLNLSEAIDLERDGKGSISHARNLDLRSRLLNSKGDRDAALELVRSALKIVVDSKEKGQVRNEVLQSLVSNLWFYERDAGTPEDVVEREIAPFLELLPEGWDILRV